jgi:hypothetical protein
MAVEAAKAGPQLAFIHVPSPHAPILFGANGTTVRVDANHPYEYWLGDDASPDDVRQAYRAQAPLIVQTIEDAVGAILEGSEAPPIVIVMSDHGSLTNLDTDPDLKLSERVSNLFAAFTPDQQELFGDVTTPVNLFPILFDAYFGTDLPRSEDRSVVSAPATLFDYQRRHPPSPAPFIVGPSAHPRRRASPWCGGLVPGRPDGDLRANLFGNPATTRTRSCARSSSPRYGDVLTVIAPADGALPWGSGRRRDCSDGRLRQPVLALVCSIIFVVAVRSCHGRAGQQAHGPP